MKGTPRAPRYNFIINVMVMVVRLAYVNTVFSFSYASLTLTPEWLFILRNRSRIRFKLAGIV
jgi:hypothetical protein